MMKSMVQELHPQVGDADKLKELVLGSKGLLPQLFFFGTVSSPKFGVWTLDKTALLGDLRARAALGKKPLAKVKLVAGEGVDWNKSGFFELHPPMRKDTDPEGHSYSHVVFRLTKKKADRACMRSSVATLGVSGALQCVKVFDR